MIVLDTNVVSELMRPRPNPVVVEWLSYRSEQLAITTVLIAEIAYGIAKIPRDQRSPRLQNNFDQICRAYESRCHAFDLPAAIIFGEIMGAAKLNGRLVHTADGQIAAIALRHRAAVATRNVSDFEALGVKVVNPWG